MPNFAVTSSSLSPSTDIRGSTSHTDNIDATTNTNTTVDSKTIIISSTHTTPSDISTSTALTVGSGKITTTQTDNDADADPGHSGQSTRRTDDHPATLGTRIKEIMTDNQLVINTFIAGGLAGATSRTVVSPLERLKIILYVLPLRQGKIERKLTRGRQVQTSSKSLSSGEAYGGVWKGLRRMWQQEGFQGFMKGNGINVVRVSSLKGSWYAGIVAERSRFYLIPHYNSR